VVRPQKTRGSPGSASGNFQKRAAAVQNGAGPLFQDRAGTTEKGRKANPACTETKARVQGHKTGTQASQGRGNVETGWSAALRRTRFKLDPNAQLVALPLGKLTIARW